MSVKETAGVLSSVDEDGNVTRMYPDIKTDETLTKSGKAADAKVVGERFKALNEADSSREVRLKNVENKADTNAKNLASFGESLSITAQMADENKTNIEKAYITLNQHATALNQHTTVLNEHNERINSKQNAITVKSSVGKSGTIRNATVEGLTYLTLAAGTYLILGSATIACQNDDSSHGMKICISTSTSFDNSYAAGGVSMAAFAVAMNCWRYLTISAQTTVYLIGYQELGGSRSFSAANLVALKLA